MDYTLTTAPSHEPVSIERARRHLRIDGEDDDLSILSCLRMARSWCEQYTNRAFLWQKYQVKLDSLKEIQLPRSPLIAVDSITYVDTGGSQQTLDTDIYEVDTTSEPGRIVLAYDAEWPSIRGHHHDIAITFTAGYAVSFTRNSNTLVAAGHRFAENDCVQLYNIGGALPAGLSVGTDYYVCSVDGTAIELATTEGGDTVPLTDAGMGTHYIDAVPRHILSGILLVLTDLWSHRGDERLEPSKQVREMLGIERMVTV